MSMRWREWVEKWPSYRTELHLVAVAPGGKVAAFCSGWAGRVDREKLSASDTGDLAGQIEPMGVHPDYRNLGLGRAVLEEVFRRMQALGVKEVIVETDNFREAAQGLYRAVGFEEKYFIYKYCREF
jgi:ribosomal protein S18 acetylase RimI-like enzyme